MVGSNRTKMNLHYADGWERGRYARDNQRVSADQFAGDHNVKPS